MFVVIEGGDASGKTTLIEYIQTSINGQNTPFLSGQITFLKSPTEPFADIWRPVIKNVDTLTRFMFFRAIHQNDSAVVRKLLESGQNVILERYLYSTEAFNYTLDNLKNIIDTNLRSENHITYNGLVKPDLGILLDVSDELRENRLSERSKTDRSPWEKPEFQVPFNKKLREVANREKLEIVNTTNMSKQEMADRVISIITQNKK
jgi:thymidylate kinase